MKKYQIVQNNLIADNIISLKLRAKTEKDIFDYQPGQYAAISYHHDGGSSPMRCFSFVSIPENKGMIEFGIRVQGSFTKNLETLPRGTEVSVMGPFGDFTVNQKNISELVFIAGGIGITPFLSMIRSATIQKWSAKIILFYSFRKLSDAVYANELQSFAKQNLNFQVFFFISDEKIENPPANVFPSLLTIEYLDLILAKNYQEKSFYLCGPGGFMVAMKKNLTSRQVAPGRIITEEFSGRSQTSTANSKTIINNLIILSLAVIFIVILAQDASKYQVKANALNQNANSVAITDASAASSQPLLPTRTPTPRNKKSTVQPRIMAPIPTQKPKPIVIKPAPIRMYQPPVSAVS